MPTEPIWSTIAIDRAPVLRLWAAVVAERRGHSPGAALTLALLPGLARERRRGGWYHRDTTSEEEKRPHELRPATKPVYLLGRNIAIMSTENGWRRCGRRLRSWPAAA